MGGFRGGRGGGATVFGLILGGSLIGEKVRHTASMRRWVVIPGKNGRYKLLAFAKASAFFQRSPGGGKWPHQDGTG